MLISLHILFITYTVHGSQSGNTFRSRNYGQEISMNMKGKWKQRVTKLALWRLPFFWWVETGIPGVPFSENGSHNYIHNVKWMDTPHCRVIAICTQYECIQTYMYEVMHDNASVIAGYACEQTMSRKAFPRHDVIMLYQHHEHQSVSYFQFTARVSWKACSG